MELDRYVADLRTQLAAAAQAGGDDVRAVAERLSVALEPAVRLMLLEALSDVAGEITRELAPTSVDVRLRGRDPQIVVSRTTPHDAGLPSRSPAEPVAQAAADPVDDSETVRTTLRLPEHLKMRVERAAVQDGLSVNSWLVRAVSSALEPLTPQPDRPAGSDRAGRRSNRGTSSFTGWVR